MMCNDKLIFLLKDKYQFNEMVIDNDIYTLFSFGKGRDNNYIILKNDICTDEELSEVQKFIDSLPEKKFSNASFVFVAFVNQNFKKEDYIMFNGVSFLHTISYNLNTTQFVYNKGFYYLGSKKVKHLFKDIEKIIFDVQKAGNHSLY